MSDIDTAAIQEKVIETIRTIYDPEIPVNIYDMGMIYEVRVEENGYAYVKMTLTTPACPVAGTLPPEVEHRVAAVEGVTDAKVELVWDPPWTQDMLSEAAKLQLGLL
ncbi:MAG: SUF system Fe-S cluster assembly protein [Planctomycetota bacterium]|jgi:FeS assembly SUF system protein